MGLVSLLFSFRGRINRKQYWLGASFIGFLSFIGQMMTTAMQAGALVDGKDPGGNLASLAGSSAVASPIYAIIIWSSLAIQFKRFHDRGRTGWISLAPLIVATMLIVAIVSDALSGAPLERLAGDVLPYVAILMLIGLGFFIDLGCLPSVHGPNRYGPAPGSSGSLAPSRPSGSVDSASSLFGAQSAMDRAIAEAAKPQPVTGRAAASEAAAAARSPLPGAPLKNAPLQSAAMGSTPMGSTPMGSAPMGNAPSGFGRRIAR